MSLTSANLVGYLRAEFAKAAKYRVRLFILQLSAAMPAAVAVLVLRVVFLASKPCSYRSPGAAYEAAVLHYMSYVI
jgi:ABC-type uncharacterized transport system permease subunit